MFKNKSKWAGAALALAMVLVFTTPIFAEGEMNPVEPTEVVEETSSLFDHPIVKWIVKFMFNPTVVMEEPEPEMDGADLIGEESSPTEGPLGGGDSMEATPEPEAIPVIVPEEMVAAMHVDGDLGFGEIVKLLGIAENAQAVCVENGEENCEITLGNLLVEYEDGAGMGELFEKYVKPENLGVGQIRKEVDPKDKEKTNVGQIRKDLATEELDPKEKTNNGKAKGKNK